jgi:hypothetical protein
MSLSEASKSSKGYNQDLVFQDALEAFHPGVMTGIGFAYLSAMMHVDFWNISKYALNPLESVRKDILAMMESLTYSSSNILQFIKNRLSNGSFRISGTFLSGDIYHHHKGNAPKQFSGA